MCVDAVDEPEEDEYALVDRIIFDGGAGQRFRRRRRRDVPLMSEKYQSSKMRQSRLIPARGGED